MCAEAITTCKFAHIVHVLHVSVLRATQKTHMPASELRYIFFVSCKESCGRMSHVLKVNYIANERKSLRR